MATEKREYTNVFWISKSPKPATNPEEFKRFHELLTKGRPDITPWYIPLGKGEVTIQERKNREGTTKVAAIVGKDPLVYGSWKDEKHRLTFEHAYKRLQSGYNVGIAATDKDPYAILDVDDMELVGETKPTLQAISRKRLGRHNFYTTEEQARDDKDLYGTTAKDNIPLDDAGELRSCWQYVVAPGSFVPVGPGEYNSIPDDDKCNAGKYNILNPSEPANITFNELPEIFKAKRIADISNAIEHDFRKAHRQEREDRHSKSRLFELTAGDVLGFTYPDFEKFPSPLHDSHTGANASFTGDLLHCWRHNVSHSGYSLLAVKAGIYDCGEAGIPHKKAGCSYLKHDGEEIFKIWRYAKAHNHIPEDDPIPTKALIYYASSNGICKESDLIDGWKIPRDDYNIALLRLSDDGINPGREPLQRTPLSIEGESEEQDDLSLKALEKNRQAKKEMGLHQDLPESERRAVCREIWNKCGLNGHDFNVAYNEVFSAKKEKEERVKEESTPTHIKECAKEIAEHGDPVNFILDAHQKLHVGDENLGKTLLLSLAVQSVINSEGFQPKGSGESGDGKTHCFKTFAHLAGKWVIVTELSNKALFYMEDDLRSGVTIFFDDASLSEDMEGLLKRLQSSWQTGCEYITLDKDRKKKKLTIPPRTNVWLTSISDDQSSQLLNRQFGGEVDESPTQDKMVYAFIQEQNLTGRIGYPLNDDVLTCRELIDDFKKQAYTVVVPFANAIKFKDLKNRRNPTIFFDLIKALTILRHRQRNKTEDGALIAEYSDYEEAEKLYCSRATAQGTKLTQKERQLCELMFNVGKISFEGCCKSLNVSTSRLSQILYGKGKLHDSGALFKIKGLRIEEGTKAEYEGDKIAGSTKKKYLVFDGEYNPLEGWDKPVWFDKSLYLPYSYFTPTLPFTNDSSKDDFIHFTHNTNTQEENTSLNSNVVAGDNTLCPEDFCSIETSLSDLKKGLNGKVEADATEKQKVNCGKESKVPTNKGEIDTESLKVNSNQSRNEVAQEEVAKRCKAWEKVSGPINHANSWMAVQDIGKILKLPLDDLIQMVEKYAKVSQSRCVECGGSIIYGESRDTGEKRCKGCYDRYFSRPAAAIPEELVL